MFMMLLMLLTGMYTGETRRRFSGGTGLYPRVEGYYTSELHHWSSEGAMEAP